MTLINNKIISNINIYKLMKLPRFNEETSVKMIITIILFGLIRLIQCLILKYYFKSNPKLLSSNGVKNTILLILCSIIIIILLTKKN